MTNFDLKKINLQKLTYDTIFRLTGQHIEETMKRQKRFNSLTVEELEMIAKNCGFSPESVYDGTFRNNVSDEDFNREFDKIQPVIQRGRPKDSPTKYKFPDRETFIRIIHDAKTKIENTGEYPSQDAVAELLDFEGEKAVQRLCRRWKVRWKDI